MTVEQEVANLTTAVDNLTIAVNVKRVALDDSVDAAEAAQSAAETASQAAIAQSTAGLWFLSEDAETQTFMANPTATNVLSQDSTTITLEILT